MNAIFSYRFFLFQLFLLLGFFCCSFSLQAQKTIITGKVTDAETGDGVPFASVYFEGTTIGTSTDFDGFYKIETDKATDSLVVSYVSYQTKKKAIQKGVTQNIDYQLAPAEETLKAIVITAGKQENPAWEYLRGVLDHKSENDKRRLSAYQYDSYSKVELDVDNISDKFKEKKLVRKIVGVVDSVENLAGDDGKPILPLFISETISKYYYRDNPQKVKEEIEKTRIKGVGVEDGSIVSQLVGSSFQDYNFYQSWIQIAEKDFVSPISESWRLFYDYELQERTELDGIWCYRIDFQPKRKEDLAFTGTMWITDDSTFALKRIDATVPKSANLNFIEKIKIQQDLKPIENETKEMAWLPVKTRILVDVGQINDKWAGMLLKSYSSAENIVINKPKDIKFYKDAIVVSAEVNNSTDEFWQKNRHDSLTAGEQTVYAMIDTISNLPMVKSYIEIADLLINGYKDVGKIDIGQLLTVYSNNNIEGSRVMLNIRTNSDFSKKVQFLTGVAYGFGDKKWKYNAKFRTILSRRLWTVFGIQHQYDLQQIALFNEDFRSSSNVLFSAFSRWGDLSKNRPFYHRQSSVYLQTDIVKGLTPKITYRQQNYDPLYSFEYIDPKNTEIRKREFTVSEFMAEVRIGFRERYINADLTRANLGSKYPVIKLRYIRGLGDFLGGDLEYHKFSARIEHSFRLGIFGRTDYFMSAGFTPSTLPYPLLESHLGNETPFYNQLSFNLMNYFEFVSDKYASINLVHDFNGFLLNRIPLMRKLKWRAFVEGNVLVGNVSQKNIDLIPETNSKGEPILKFGSLDHRPYTEVSYGISNIFRFVRVQAVHRLTYLEKDDVSPWGIRVSAQFRL
ncbi:DUF5686 and carboxypeptidase-like regulatory domain-containing protein [Bernardetia sp.]|uniref:DUF5686 and carboxypeptidase-like regulatory domain-containing protein n=1 Tax=Bernardetia sp. TaxID=1937974 RepID=UPI0025BD8F5A|nr:DUF5686 and carboxypeptidase-like regulatory domain-containing protein [Bernardetia sp.]